jgi:ribokinase
MFEPRPVAVVGSINVDLTAVAPRLPEPGETVGDGVFGRTAGGKGANQAAAASRLGAATRMIGAVGDDQDGEWMRRALAAAGVGTADIRVVPSTTGVALIAVDALGENQIVVCPGANGAVSLEGVRFADDELVLTQLEIPLETVAELAAMVPGYFAVNAAPARHLPPTVIDRADLIIVNESEFALQPELQQARRVAVTYGSDGAALLEHGRTTSRVPSPRVTPVNSVGAGDAFCAALATALGSGMPAEQALRTACAVGAAAVTFSESQPPLQSLGFYEPR